jgi:hypothetical protein
LAYVCGENNLVYPRGGGCVGEQVASAGDGFPLELAAADGARNAVAADEHESARLARG